MHSTSLVSFVAAWSQMLVYVATGRSVGLLRSALPRSTGEHCSDWWNIVGGAIVIVVLVVLNIVGVTEAAKL